MITLADHGLGVGSNSFTRFTKVTASISQPTTPQLNDIWLKTDKAINDIFFLEDDTTVASGDVFIKTTNKEMNFKPIIDKGKGHIKMPTLVSSNPKVLETNYFDVHAFLALARINDNGSKKILDAYYWNGTTWKQFSIGTSLAFISVGTGATTQFFAIDTNTLEVKASTISGAYDIEFGVDESNGLIYTQKYPQNFFKLDFNLNVVGSYPSSSNYISYIYDVVEEDKVLVKRSDYRSKWNIKTNGAIWELKPDQALTYSPSGARYYRTQNKALFYEGYNGVSHIHRATLVSGDDIANKKEFSTDRAVNAVLDYSDSGAIWHTYSSDNVVRRLGGSSAKSISIPSASIMDYKIGMDKQGYLYVHGFKSSKCTLFKVDSVTGAVAWEYPIDTTLYFREFIIDDTGAVLGVLSDGSKIIKIANGTKVAELLNTSFGSKSINVIKYSNE